jgi:hypothetical protein
MGADGEMQSTRSLLTYRSGTKLVICASLLKNLHDASPTLKKLVPLIVNDVAPF